MRFAVIVITTVILVFYGHFLANALRAGNYWLYALCLILTLVFGYAMQTEREERAFRVWLRRRLRLWGLRK
jgi:hypothetical protein